MAGTIAVVADLRPRQRRLPARARARRAGVHDDAGRRRGAADVWNARRSVRHRGDRDLDVRLSRSRDPRADARLLRDGGRRLVLSGARARCTRDIARRALAIVLQTAWSCILALSGTLRSSCSTTSCSPTGSSSALTVATLLVFRRTVPLHGRPPQARFAHPAIQSCRSCSSLVAAAVVLSVVWADPRKRVARRAAARRGHSGVLLVQREAATAAPRNQIRHYDIASISRAVHGMGEEPPCRPVRSRGQQYSVRARSTSFPEFATRSRSTARTRTATGRCSNRSRRATASRPTA